MEVLQTPFDARGNFRLQKVVLTADDLRREAAVAAARLRVARYASGPTPAARHDSSPADLVHRLTQLGELTRTHVRGLHLHPHAHFVHDLNSKRRSQAADTLANGYTSCYY